MKRGMWILTALLTVALVAPAQAQRVTTRGIVDRIDLGTGVVTLRMINGAREPVIIKPDAEFLVNGRGGTLAEVMYNARAEFHAWRDRAGQLHADVARIDQPATPTRIASTDPGAIIAGEIAGIFPEAGILILRTPTGFRNVALGTAPIIMEGRSVTTMDLALGDHIRVQRTVPPGGLVGIPTMAVVTAPHRVAGARQTFRSPEAAPQQPILPAQRPAPGGTTASPNYP
jgi:hypothetical protein